MQVKKGRYRCWDGSIYRVVNVGIDKETGKRVVVYQLDIKKTQNGGYEPAKFTMSADRFLSDIDPNPKMTRGRVPRFTKIDDV